MESRFLLRLTVDGWLVADYHNRSTSGFEVDFIIGKKLAIGVKGTQLIKDKHLAGIRVLKEEKFWEIQLL